MRVIIGVEDGYVRIIGPEFTAYVNSLTSFKGLINKLGVTHANFDGSLHANDLLKKQITEILTLNSPNGKED